MTLNDVMAKVVKIERQDKPHVSAISFDRNAANVFQSYLQGEWSRVGLRRGEGRERPFRGTRMGMAQTGGDRRLAAVGRLAWVFPNRRHHPHFASSTTTSRLRPAAVPMWLATPRFSSIHYECNTAPPQGAFNFSIKRGGILYGTVLEEEGPEPGKTETHVRVDFIYEPPQEGSADTLTLQRHTPEEQQVRRLRRRRGTGDRAGDGGGMVWWLSCLPLPRPSPNQSRLEPTASLPLLAWCGSVWPGICNPPPRNYI